MHRARFSLICSLAVAAAALSGCSSDDKKQSVQTLVQVLAREAPPTDPLPSKHGVDEPSSYRITFDRFVSTESDKPLTETKFTRRVIRPFDETGDITRTLGFAREAGSAVARVALVRPLPDDPRPRVYRAPAGARHRVVAGRRCVESVVGTETFCIDDAGLVLVKRTKRLLEIATKVTIDTETKPVAELTASLAMGFTDVNRGSIRPMDPNSTPPGTDWALDGTPAGFELVGRYAVAPLTGEVLKRNSRKVVANIVDVYVRGMDALVVERGGKLDTSDVGDGDLGRLTNEHAVELGALGSGTAGIGGVGAFDYRELRAFPAQGRYVVVAGTLPEEELLEIARSLKARPGTTIRYLDKP